jgi:hypothetical protein
MKNPACRFVAGGLSPVWGSYFSARRLPPLFYKGNAAQGVLYETFCSHFGI